MTIWRMLVEFEDVLSGAKLIEVEADTLEKGIELLKEKTPYLLPDNFYEWKKTEDFKTWKLQSSIKSKNYLLNIFEDEVKVMLEKEDVAE